MRWPVFIVVAVIAVSVEIVVLSTRFVIPSLLQIYPSIVGVLLVFIALSAPKLVTLWAAWTLGMLMDFSLTDDTLHVGPHALGYVFGAYLVLQVRTMVFRRRAMTIALLTLMCLAASGIVETALIAVRSWSNEADNVRALSELIRRMGIAGYSALLAIPVGWALVQTSALWGFHQSERRRTR